MNHPVRMFHYNAWATQTLLNRIGELPPSVIHEEVGTSFPTIAEAFSHMFAVEKGWYEVARGMDMQEALTAVMPLQQEMRNYTASEFGEAFADLAGQYREWFAAEKNLERNILLANPYAGTREIRLSEILLHLVNHGTYHRGNVSAMLRQLGHASTMTDYALFWYQDPA